MATTKRGQGLALKLGLSRFGPEAETCSRIHRLAVTYARLMEYACNGDPIRQFATYGKPAEELRRLDAIAAEREAAAEAKAERIEKRIRELVRSLGEGFEADLQGDPRGAVVCVKNPGGHRDTYDRGIYVA